MLSWYCTCNFYYDEYHCCYFTATNSTFSRSHDAHGSCCVLCCIADVDVLFGSLQDKDWWDQPEEGWGAEGHEHPHPETTVRPHGSQSGQTHTHTYRFSLQPSWPACLWPAWDYKKEDRSLAPVRAMTSTEQSLKLDLNIFSLELFPILRSITEQTV